MEGGYLLKKSVFAKQLNKYRKLNRLSQEKLAEKLHISRQAISRWKSEDATPDLNTLIMLSEIFHCSLDDLVLGVNQVAEQKLHTKEEHVKTPKYMWETTGGIILGLGCILYLIISTIF